MAPATVGPGAVIEPPVAATLLIGSNAVETHALRQRTVARYRAVHVHAPPQRAAFVRIQREDVAGFGSVMVYKRVGVLPCFFLPSSWPSIGSMKGSFALVCLATAAAAGGLADARAGAQTAPALNGVWALNRSLSEFPREMGFNVDWIASPTGDGQSAGSAGGRGRRGSGGGRGSAGPFSTRLESYEDARRVQLVTAEARNPPAQLIVVDTPAAVTITNELGQSRALRPDGKEQSIEVEGVPILVTTTRDADRLVVVYHVEQGRDVRYTYSRSAAPPQLIVEVQFLEHGEGDRARRVYEPGADTRTLASGPAAAAPAPLASQARETFDARPGAELKGLKNLGILVEDLSAQAVACGLDRDAIETALSQRLATAGFSVRRNSDEDTYLYVNVMTTTVPNGTCVSRYDAFLYTHATASLSYRDQPVLVQVSLMHRGGIGSSAASAHGTAVARALESYVDLFVAQVRDANK